MDKSNKIFKYVVIIGSLLYIFVMIFPSLTLFFSDLNDKDLIGDLLFWLFALYMMYKIDE